MLFDEEYYHLLAKAKAKDVILQKVKQINEKRDLCTEHRLKKLVKPLLGEAFLSECVNDLIEQGSIVCVRKNKLVIEEDFQMRKMAQKKSILKKVEERQLENKLSEVFDIYYALSDTLGTLEVCRDLLKELVESNELIEYEHAYSLPNIVLDYDPISAYSNESEKDDDGKRPRSKSKSPATRTKSGGFCTTHLETNDGSKPMDSGDETVLKDFESLTIDEECSISDDESDDDTTEDESWESGGDVLANIHHSLMPIDEATASENKSDVQIGPSDNYSGDSCSKDKIDSSRSTGDQQEDETSEIIERKMEFKKSETEEIVDIKEDIGSGDMQADCNFKQ